VGALTKSFSVKANPLASNEPAGGPYSRAPLDFHRRLPGYEPTPLLSVPRIADQLDVGSLWVKSETTRFGLPAFKMLGASWATYRALCERMGAEPAGWQSVAELAGRLRPLLPFTLAAATDGNHGMAVARMARWLGFSAHIFVPEGTAMARIEAIRREGAEVTVVDGDYDAAVARSAEEAGERCLVVSDISWPGYEEVPRLVIEGYSTLYWEIDDSLQAAGLGAPDVVVVPVGVGALAAATVNHWSRHQPQPVIVGVEPEDAACVMASALAGGLTTVPGPHRSIMAGLNCGTPSPVAWPVVSSGVSTLVAIGDGWAEDAVRELAASGIEAGETGAAALAGLAALQASDRPIGCDAKVLVVCTEGITDPVARWRILGVDVVGDRGGSGS